MRKIHLVIKKDGELVYACEHTDDTDNVEANLDLMYRKAWEDALTNEFKCYKCNKIYKKIIENENSN